MVVHTVNNRINQLHTGVLSEYTGERSLVLKQSTMQAPEEELWKELQANVKRLCSHTDH